MPKSLNIYCDGGSRGNPGPGASAFIVLDNMNISIYRQGNYLGRVTNNEAEYQAVLHALEWLIASEFRYLEVNFYLDSLLVVNQLSGIYRIKENHLKYLHNLIVKNISSYQILVKSFNHIPRSENSLADLLVNQTLDTLD